MLPASRSVAQTVQLDSLVHRYGFYAQWCAPEKLYLHLDRAYYAYGETIWFNGYLVNATQRAVLPESNYIYVELLDSKGGSVVRVKVKRDPSAGFPGHMEIPDNIGSGLYTVRAYTLWNLNNPADYMFHQQVKILGQEPPKKTSEGAVKLDVSFYPEGGRYFAGSKSYVGFKVMNSLGQSVDVKGWLVDDLGNYESAAVTTHDGMGSFAFVPGLGRNYSFNIDGKSFPLPAPSSEGMTIGLRRSGDYYMVRICGATPGRYRLFVRDASEIAPITTLDFNRRELLFKIEARAFRGGINHLLLTDVHGRIVSERLFYVADAPGPVCTLEQRQKTSAARELLSSEVRLAAPDGTPIDGSFSVSVVRGSFARYQQNDDIISYMRLSSELKGTINSPSHYFDESVPEPVRARDLDHLMMIQGWRYYDMDQVEKTDKSSFKLNYAKEMYQSIKGRIERALSSRVPKKFIFTVFIPRIGYTAIEDVEQAKYFSLEDIDLQENTGVFIKVDRMDSGVDYMPKWAGDVFAPPFRYAAAAGVAGQMVERENIPLEANLAMTDTLQAAIVSATVDPFPNVFGGRTVTSSDLKMFGTFRLTDYVKMQTFGFEYTNGNMVSRRRGFSGSLDGGNQSEEENAAKEDDPGEESAGGGAVKLVVDDSEQPWEMFESVTMDDVEAINISTSPDYFYNSPGGLVTLKMKSGVELERHFNLERSMAYFVPLGWQTPKAFYSPRYDQGATSDFFDNRNTIYWNPCISVSDGLAAVEFCNTDQQDYPYIVRIEGRTASGEFFSCHTLLEYR